MTQPANHDPITRARQLAADYQANPTPARAHNAAQVLGAVLDQLDGARRLNTDMWGLIAKLALRSPGDRATAIAALGNGYRTGIPGPDLCRHPEGDQLCGLPRAHHGDHYLIHMPGFPIVVPADQLPPATGGIVDTTTARIGENS